MFRSFPVLFASLVTFNAWTIKTQEAAPIDWKAVESRSAEAVSAKLRNAYLFPKFLKDGQSLFYNYAQGDSVTQVFVDLRSGRKEPLIRDIRDMLSQLARLSGDTIAPADFSLFNVSFEDDTHSVIRFKQKGKEYLLNRGTGKLTLADPRPEVPQKRVEPSLFSGATTADSLFTMYQEGTKLICRNNRTAKEDTLATDLLTKIYADKEPTMSRREAGGYWMGHIYVHYAEEKDKEIQEIWQINALAEPRPKLRTMKMPMPGEDNYPSQRLLLYNAETQIEKMPEIRFFGEQETTPARPVTEDRLYFSRTNRAGDTLQLCRLDVKSGTVRTLISEETKPVHNLSLFNFKILGQKGDSILWWSERDGYGKYYLYNGEGKLLRKLIRDPKLVAGRIVRHLKETGELLIEGYGGRGADNPLLKSYFLVPLKGKKGERRLTPPDRDSELEISPDGHYAFVRSSRIDVPPAFSVYDLHRPSSRPILLSQVTEKEALEAGWVKPLPVTCLAADGSTNLYGVMYRPSSFDPSEKYPVIVYVYPGPQTDLLPTGFTPDDNANQTLAECGFVVLQVPPRGSSPLRGRDFYTFGHGNLRDYPAADIRASVEHLAKMYPYMDLSRVGIYGHSGGGFATVVSMLTYPGFYKAGIAASGNYDNNIYIQWWGERFHGYPLSGKIPTAMELADNLADPLLLMVGDSDKNVPPASTIRMADALMKAGKDFEMMIFPGKDHELDCPYYFNKIKYFFLRHLRGMEENAINIISHH